MADSQPGPRPAWSGWGFGAAALVVALFVIFFAPAAPVPPSDLPPSTPTTAGHRITLDELQAMLTDSPGEPPASFEVDTPDGPVTVVIPPTTTTEPPRTTTTTSTTTTTLPPSPRPTLPPVDAGDILDEILGQAVPTTSEVVGDEE